MSGPSVVVIGAGVVGAALADELTERGWTDVTVVDAGPIPHTGGSTTHAPGLVFQANGSRMMSELATYTVEKLVALTSDLEGDEGPCFLQVGGLEVATTPDRLRDLHRRAGWLAANGVGARVLTAAECVEAHDLLDPAVVLGGLHTPTDGLAKAVRAVHAQTQRAASRGARLVPGTEVTDVVVEDGRVVGVETTAGRIDAEIVVCCAGIWGQKVAGMVGMSLPLTPLEHQLVRTTAVPAMAGQEQEVVRPILRHQGEDLYYRDEHDHQVVGSYAHRPIPVPYDEFAGWDAMDDEQGVMPSVRPYTPEDFEGPWKDSQALLPALAEAEVASGINGMFSFTTDGAPLIGECPDARGFWVAEAVWVTHSAGVGRAVAELLVDGVTTTDLHEAALDRFEPHQVGPSYVLERDQQNFVEVYDLLHPLQPMESPRPLRLPPFHQRQRELDGYFLEANGWERPQWYAANAPLLETYDVPTPGDWASRYWSPIAGAEALAARERVAMFDMTALKRIEVVGRGATAFLQGLVTGNVATSVGSVTYCLLLDPRGRIRSDVTVARLSAPPGQQRYQVGANGNLDLAYLQALAPADVFVHDITPGTCCIGLWGPAAREVVQSVSTDDFSNAGVKYFRAIEAHVGMVPVTAMRLSYVGELGWELYTTADLGMKLWDTLWAAGREHGILAGGRAAFSSMRLEKGYRSFGADMTWDHDPYEAGLGFAVKMTKDDFVGRAALADRDPEAVTRKLVCLTSTDPLAVVMGKEPVLHDGTPVGYVTSAAWGFTVQRAIAYAWVPAALATPGTEVTVGYFDQQLPYTVTEEPLFDPAMTRLRG